MVNTLPVDNLCAIDFLSPCSLWQERHFYVEKRKKGSNSLSSTNKTYTDLLNNGSWNIPRSTEWPSKVYGLQRTVFAPKVTTHPISSRIWSLLMRSLGKHGKHASVVDRRRCGQHICALWEIYHYSTSNEPHACRIYGRISYTYILKL
jgi:hypothetical protein